MDTIDTMQTTDLRSSLLQVPRSAEACIEHACRKMFSWLQRRATRRTLRDLTDDQLSDIGLTRREAMVEVSKSFFWD